MNENKFNIMFISPKKQQGNYTRKIDEEWKSKGLNR